MSRREANATVSAIVSVVDSLKSLVARCLHYVSGETGLDLLNEAVFQRLRLEQKLSQMLSPKTYLSISSTSAECKQEVAGCVKPRAFREIGSGQCGVVWSLTGTTETLKTANSGKVDQLYNNWDLHDLVRRQFESAFTEFKKDINVPAIGPWHSPTDDRFWNPHLEFFPAGFCPTYGFESERIFPVPCGVREAIFDAFAPREIRGHKDEFFDRVENNDCLVRLYLGRRGVKRHGFKFRNFELMVDEMEWFCLDTEHYATVMADTLAFLHWRVNIDANDVEFVLGSSAARRFLPAREEIRAADTDSVPQLGHELDFRGCSLGIWLLDFDQCRRFTEDAAGLKQLEKGFFFNDPYYPRPAAKDQKDQKLWRVFKKAYLDASARLTESSMPKNFIEAVEKEGIERAKRASLFQ